MPESLKIILLSTLAAIAYGIAHDQVTAHVCVEYFTVFHPPVFPTRSPFLLALGWGVIATWWVGLPLGTGLALAARLGPEPRLAWRDLRAGVIALMLVLLACALAVGAVGAWLVASGRTGVPAWAQPFPKWKYAALSFDMWAHATSYLGGVLGGLLVIGLAVGRRFARRRG